NVKRLGLGLGSARPARARIVVAEVAHSVLGDGRRTGPPRLKRRPAAGTRKPSQNRRPAARRQRPAPAAATSNSHNRAMARHFERGSGLSTSRQRARVEIEIGLWGSLVTALLFFTCGIVDYFTTDDVTWISGLGCLVGLATIASILIRAHLSNATVRARPALRKLRRH